MGFLGIYTALYDYQPQAENELEINEGDLLYVLDKSTDDDWWKAKKKAAVEDDDEPVGLVPNNYVEEVHTPPFPHCCPVLHSWDMLVYGLSKGECQTDGRGQL